MDEVTMTRYVIQHEDGDFVTGDETPGERFHIDLRKSQLFMSRWDAEKRIKSWSTELPEIKPRLRAKEVRVTIRVVG
jgi:hypothetical protein